MPTRAIYLAKFRHSRDQRAHFAIFIPALTDTDHDPNEKTSPCVGTLINVVGTPMTGFVHEIRATYPCRSEQQLERFVRLGVVDDDLAPGTRDGGSTTGNEKKGKKRSSLVEVALQILPPWRSENFLAPVDDVKNRRCQEWTMEFLRRLVELGCLEAGTIDVAEAERDSPKHGVGLRPVELRGWKASTGQAGA